MELPAPPAGAARCCVATLPLDLLLLLLPAHTLRVFSFMPRGPSAHTTWSARAAGCCCCCFCCARTGLGAAAMPLALEVRPFAATKGLGACKQKVGSR